MRAGRSKRSRLKRLAIPAVVLATLSPVLIAHAGSPAPAATTHCQPRYTQVPCLGPIQTEYTFGGSGFGALGSIWAKLGSTTVVEQSVHGQELTEVKERSFTWHSKPNVEIVAVYVLTDVPNTNKYVVRKLSTGLHSGHTVLRSVLRTSPSRFSSTTPILLLQGRRTGTTTPAPTQHCYVREVPCLGKVQVLYSFSGKAGGALHSIRATLGPEEDVGTTPEGKPIKRRSATWTSVATVRLVAAYVLVTVSEHGKARWRIHRIPTATHSGRATLTTEPEPQGLESGPLLLLEGERAY
jgi:hypothetical protein